MDPPTQSNHVQTTVFVFMGVAGCGKSTAAADFLSSLAPTSIPPAPFFEADDFHSPENKAKMASGTPLTDTDRRPWLASLGAAIAGAAPAPVVVATCSALKRAYRRVLAATISKATSARVVCVWLDVPEHELQARLCSRSGHYMGASMLASQLATLEVPTLDEVGDEVGDDGALPAYRVARVDCGSTVDGEPGPLGRPQVLQRVVDAVLRVCPDMVEKLCAK